MVNKKIKKVFMDLEFTSLRKDADLISIALISEDGKKIYTEFNDYSADKVNDWISDNVISNLIFNDMESVKEYKQSSDLLLIKGNRLVIREEILSFLKDLTEGYEYTIEFWGDCISHDWVFMCDLLADYVNDYPLLPDYIYYIPFDLCTLLKCLDIDPDINRSSIIKTDDTIQIDKKHNSLFDAGLIKLWVTNLI